MSIEAKDPPSAASQGILPLPLETQTLYGELLEHLRVDQLHRSIGSLQGAFTQREKPSGRYWYFRTSEGPESRSLEFYIGPDHEDTRALIQAYAQGRVTAKESEARVVRLSAMLRSGGITLTDAPSARIIKGLGAAGLFGLGGMLVGAHAFAALGNALGLKWPSALRTQDVDFAAHPREIQVGIPMDSQLTMDVPATIEALRMGFLPHIRPHSQEGPTSYVVMGKETRIDLLTCPKGKDRDTPIRIPRLNAHAQPLEFMNYLLEKPMEGLIVNGSATWVRIPQPARFAIHKLLVASKRDPRFHAKAAKDRQQAALLLTYLHEARPGDILLAAEDVVRRGPNWTNRLRQEVSRIPYDFPELRGVVGAKA